MRAARERALDKPRAQEHAAELLRARKK